MRPQAGTTIQHDISLAPSTVFVFAFLFGTSELVRLGSVTCISSRLNILFALEI